MLSRSIRSKSAVITIPISFGRQCGPNRTVGTSRSPFDLNQNEDGFMMVGKGTNPSVLRPNLTGGSSTTSDENWAQILDDIDPPSPSVLQSARALLRPTAPFAQPTRRHTVTEAELQTMEKIFETVFDLNEPNSIRNPFKPGKSRLAKPLAFGSDPEHQLDEKRVEMYKCGSDLKLLQWTMKNVFLQTTDLSSSTPPPASSASSSPATVLRELHPEIYGRMVASVMVEFRERFGNPHLAIAIFDHTRRLSIISYVTGCTAHSYTELMRTHWTSFRNLQAVVNVAEEMRINGVSPNQGTTTLLNQIRDGVGSRITSAEGGDAGVTKLFNRLSEALEPPKHVPLASPKRRSENHNKDKRVENLFKDLGL